MAAITGAVIGLAATAVSVGMSVSGANKASKERAKAQKEAEKAMAEAKRELEIMPMQELSLNLDVYKQAQEAQNVAAATAIDVAQQGEGRGLAAAVGRTQMANIEGQQAVRQTQSADMLSLDTIKAQERQDASNALTNLNIAEAEGAQAAASDAATRQAAATQQAVQSGAQGITGAMNLYSSVQGAYDPTMAGMQAKDLVSSEIGAGRDTKMIQGFLSSNPDQYLGQGVDVSDLGTMSDMAFQAWLASNLSADQQRTLMSSFQSGASMNRPSF